MKKAWEIVAFYAREGVVWKAFAMLLLAALVIIITYNVKASNRPKPIYVVPGAKPGLYNPGEGVEDIVRDIAERHVLLIANVTAGTAELVVKRACFYLSPEYSSKFIDEQRIISEAMKSGSMTYGFSPSPGVVMKVDDRNYKVTMKGVRTMISGGGPKSTENYMYEVYVEQTTPTDVNIYGYQITRVSKGKVD